MKNDWIKTSDELPPCDGVYEMCNDVHNFMYINGMAYYDGIGFLCDKIYKMPDFWRKPQENIKKYGKQNEKN